MIHIATVHYKTDKWIDIQLRYINQNISEPFRIYTYLCGKALKHSNKFYKSFSGKLQDHASKLNFLAKKILEEANNEDILIFIDGDAFPITNLMPFVKSKLAHHPLMSIQMREFFNDIQPHPSFCATTCSFWSCINGDWSKGHQWLQPSGKPYTDVGGNLLKKLNDYNVEWYRLLRSGSIKPNITFFGIYDNVIYHHGAGFRHSSSLQSFYSMFNKFYIALPKFFKPSKRVEIFIKQRRRKVLLYLGIKHLFILINAFVSLSIYRKIKKNDQFFLNLTQYQ